MTTQELYEGLLLTGYPVAYRAHKTAVAFPYLVYLFVNDADFNADDINYAGFGDYQIELYTEDKDEAAEAIVEAALVTLGLPWSKTETYLDTEDMHEVLYGVRLTLAATPDSDESI